MPSYRNRNIVSKTLLFLSLALLSACSTDLELEAEWRDIPIVYGFLSTADTAHYIRVEKAFLEPGGDALSIARKPDSLYYGEALVVQLERRSNGERFSLHRVDGVREGYPRAEGIFATQPNYLYKIRAGELQLKAGERIGLWIDRGEGTEPVTAETTILEELTFAASSPPATINWDYNRLVTFRWRTGPNTRLFDLRLLIHLEEYPAGQPDNLSDRTLVWVLAEALENTEGAAQMSFSVLGEDFYKFLAASIQSADGRVRRFKGLDVQVAGVGREFLEFNRVNLANAGITGSQNVPVYTNLSAGRGLFSSRAVALRQGLNLSSASRDSLRYGVHTRNLNFQ